MPKRFSLFVALFALSVPAFAATLLENMQAEGALFRTIKQTMRDPAQNANNAANAGKMAALFKIIRDQIPDSITEMPAKDRDAAIADFQRLIDEETEHAVSLKAAFLANDNNAAVGIVGHMDLDKREGHERYNH